MDILLNESESLIKAKWKLRASLLKKAEDQKTQNYNDALNQAVEQYKKDFPEILALEGITDEIVKDTVRETFVYLPSDTDAKKVEDILTQAYAIIPKEIGTEKHLPDTCRCIVHNLWVHINEQHVSQTFNSIPCAVHIGLTSAELHDTIENEIQTKSAVERELVAIESISEIIPTEEPVLGADGEVKVHRKLKEGIYKWAFTGEGKNRVLRVDIDIPAEDKKRIKEKIESQNKKLVWGNL